MQVRECVGTQRRHPKGLVFDLEPLNGAGSNRLLHGRGGPCLSKIRYALRGPRRCSGRVIDFVHDNRVVPGFGLADFHRFFSSLPLLAIVA